VCPPTPTPLSPSAQSHRFGPAWRRSRRFTEPALQYWNAALGQRAGARIRNGDAPLAPPAGVPRLVQRLPRPTRRLLCPLSVTGPCESPRAAPLALLRKYRGAVLAPPQTLRSLGRSSGPTAGAAEVSGSPLPAGTAGFVIDASLRLLGQMATSESAAVCCWMPPRGGIRARFQGAADFPPTRHPGHSVDRLAGDDQPLADGAAPRRHGVQLDVGGAGSGVTVDRPPVAQP
jgi:hypothetical protein